MWPLPRIKLWAWVMASLVVACAPALASEAAPGTDVVAASEAATDHIDAKLNPYGHTIVLTVPVIERTTYRGDIALTIDEHAAMSVPCARLRDLLIADISSRALAAVDPLLAERSSVGLEALKAAGISMQYRADKIELELQVAARLRASQTLSVASLARPSLGDYEAPAAYSGYLNLRGELPYEEAAGSDALQSPFAFLDGALRVRHVVLESQGTLQPGTAESAFQRQDSRLVFDDLKDLIRWSLGDLDPVTRGFQSAPLLAGISLFRSYQVLQPQMIARPTGNKRFTLDHPATVEIWVNGQLLQRVHLEPGSYDLRDFPFTQGIDDVRVVIQDDSGGRQVLNFSLFADQTQLAEGLSEFGLYAGVSAPLGAVGPIYSHTPEITGFYRRGLSEQLTVGANLQANTYAGMGGLEATYSTSFGAFNADLAGSTAHAGGSGIATLLTFQTLRQRENSTSDSFSASIETWSRYFAPIDLQSQNMAVTPLGVDTSGSPTGRAGAQWSYATAGSANPSAAALLNALEYQLGGSYSHAFTRQVNAGVSLHFGKGRTPWPDTGLYEATLSWRPTMETSLNLASGYQQSVLGTRGGSLVQLSFTIQLDRSQSVMASYDSTQATERTGYTIQEGDGTGSLDGAAVLERTPQNADVDGTFTYLASAAELGVDHLTTFGGGAAYGSDSRTDLRMATSIEFADDAIAIGRPVTDSFAIVTRDANLQGADVLLNPTPFGYDAKTTVLGTATKPDLGSYSERVITVDAPNAPEDAELGQGTYRLMPPYHSGYKLEAGSEYSVTAIGRLLDADGAPLALTAGSVVELGVPRREPAQIFTNREGRFGIPNVRAGRWQITMATTPAGTAYLIEIPPGTMGAVKVGDVRPQGDARP